MKHKEKEHSKEKMHHEKKHDGHKKSAASGMHGCKMGMKTPMGHKGK